MQGKTNPFGRSGVVRGLWRGKGFPERESRVELENWLERLKKGKKEAVSIKRVAADSHSVGKLEIKKKKNGT